MLPAFGLYTHIRANRIRSVLLVAGLFLLVYVLAFAFALLAGVFLGPPPAEGDVAAYLAQAFDSMLYVAPAATLGTLAWVSVSYFAHQKIIDLVTGSHAAAPAETAWLRDMLEELCISRGMRTPALKIMESPALNAYATGLDESQYAITVTRGLVEALDEREMRAVLAHELTHIRNEDVRMMVVAVVIAGAISFFAELVFRMLRHAPRIGVSGDGGRGGGRRSKGGGALGAILVALALIAIAWALSLVIRFALARSREFLADAGAVELTKDPDALISALTKIAGRGELDGVPSSVMEMCVDNPRSGFADLFATHPPIEERIEALVRYAGGRLAVAPVTPEASL